MRDVTVFMFWFMNDWGRFGRSYEQIARNLSAMTSIKKVVCVLPPDAFVSKKSLWPFRILEHSPKLFVMAFNDSFLKDIFKKIIVGFVLWVHRFQKERTLLWIFPPHPMIDSLVSLVPHQKCVVQIVDNNTLAEKDSGEKKSFARAQYERLAARADKMVVSSQLNQDIFSKMHKACALFENGLDPDFISRPDAQPSRIQESRPRIGYLGFATERTNIELLIYLASQRPDYDFILIGPIMRYGLKSGEIDRLLGMENVKEMGAQPYKAGPGLIKSFDVCMIPHKDTLYSRSMNPLKLLQYLGSGRPVVSTPIAGVEKWKGYIAVAEKPEEFLKAIDDALKNDTLEKAQTRIEAVKGETWDLRTAAILDFILE